ncbi:MAG: tRNA (N6-isopentenyl adenosine(37)-C2)-methylthiotransferase MiaB [Epulopiscium sp. Nele67-Bin005]|nr:MAG: tRNA (N6-isopentenyl adenosine(37)-C2)-methylthiotransferase MiaB [Epulopiscium sp. Nele67-Bin005]
MSERKVVTVTTAEAKRQNDIMLELAQHLQDKELKYWLQTFGCQMNAHDSEKIEGMLKKMGYVKANSENEADFILYNTCCVRENAELKIFGKLGHLKSRKRKNPNLMIALCGCMMQQDIVLDTLKKKYNFVDMIFGTYNIYKLPELLQTRFETQENVIDIWEKHEHIVEDLPSIRKHNFKSCVNIMYGCNNFCTYCIVPYVRGRERSRELNDILDDIKKLVNDGVVEIMLLGQNVNSYGKTLTPPLNFANLLEHVAQIEGLKRVRFMTSHPKDLSDELIEVMAKYPTICDNLHLPFQSGSSKVLKTMNRGYTKEDYLELVSKIKLAIPHITLTSDIIVGFPDETEEDFEHTLDVVKEVEFISAFTFIYSKRTGTPAATMNGQVDETVVKDRFNRLIATLDPISARIMNSQIGKTETILVEEISKNGNNIYSGRTDAGILVHVELPENKIGQFVDVKITSAKTHYLNGELI